MNYIKKEKDVRDEFNHQNKTKTVKAVLPIGNQGAKHEYDLFEKGKIIGGISTSPWFNKTGSNNTGGQDRASAELFWLSLWNGMEKRVHILTDFEMAKRLHQRFKGVPLNAKIEIIHFDLTEKHFKSIGKLG
jgi:hypothetical protein